MKCCGEGTEVLRKMKKFENDNRTHNMYFCVARWRRPRFSVNLHPPSDPSLAYIKSFPPQPCRKRQRVADTKAKIGRGEGGRTNPIRCEGDPSRRKYTSNADEGHMVRPGSRKSWEAKLQVLPVAEKQWEMQSRRGDGLPQVVEFILSHFTHNTIIFASLSLF